MLRTTGLAHDALVVLEEQGWDAFLSLQVAQRRARRRLPWRRSQPLPKLEGKPQEEAEAPEGGSAEAAADGEEEEALQRTGQQHAASLRSAVSALSVRARPQVERAVSMRGPVEQHPEDGFPLPPEAAAAAEGAAAQSAAGS